MRLISIPHKMYSLSISAALHYFAALPILIDYAEKQPNRFIRIYFGTIMMATTLSIVWHIYPSSIILFLCDYTFAVLWFLLDYMWYRLLNKPIIFEMNFLVFLIYMLSMFYTNYEFAHYVWHIISATKCVYVSYIIHKFDKNNNAE